MRIIKRSGNVTFIATDKSVAINVYGDGAVGAGGVPSALGFSLYSLSDGYKPSAINVKSLRDFFPQPATDATM